MLMLSWLQRHACNNCQCPRMEMWQPLPMCAGLHDLLPRKLLHAAVETALAGFGQAPFNCVGTTCGGTIAQDGGATTTNCAGTTRGGTISQDGGATTTTTTPHVVGAGLRGTGECSAVTWTADANIGWTGAETTEASVQTWEDGCSY